jgi:iron complex outermembrane recepter protein
MRRIYFIYSILLLFACPALAQNYGSIKGSIVNENTDPLAGITIRLAATNFGTSTDENGLFELKNVPAGTYQLEASGVGFAAQKQDITVVSGQTLSLSLQLNIADNTLQEVVINAAKGYNMPVSQTAKLPGKLLDIPQSVKIISRDLIDDRQAFLFKEVLKNTPGVNLMSGSSDIMIRGFANTGGSAAGSAQLINGSRNFFTGYTNDLNLTNIERVEILKGPASVLFGANSPGGAINAITKKPVEEELYQAAASYGTWGRYRVEADVSSALTKDKKLLYRFTTGYQNEPDYRDFIYNRNFIVAPTLRFLPAESTTIDVEFVYNQISRSTWYDWGYPAWQGDVFAIPITYTPHEPTDGIVLKNTMLMLSLQQRIAENLTFHSNFNGSGHRLDGQAHSPTFFNPVPGEDSLVARVYREATEDNSGTFLGNYLTWKPELGKIKLTLTGGIDYFKTKYFYNINQASGFNGVPPIHVFSPVYRAKSIRTYPATGGFNDIADTEFTGYYLMNLIELGDKLKLMLSGRYDTYRFRNTTRTPNLTEAFLPNIGLSYQPVKDLSIYGSWNKGFLPQNTQSPDFGGPFDPEYSEQLEFGAKKDFFNGRLSATAAWYKIKRRNVLVPADPVNDPFGLKEATGQARSTGVEVDLAGQVLPGWQLNGGYAYNDSRITQSAYEFEIERQVNNAPYHTASFWSRYTLPGRVLKGLGIGAGLYYIGDRTTDGTLSFPSPELQRLPAYTLLDAALYYRTGQLAFSLNMDNLLNERYIYGASNAFYLQPGKPRNILLRVQMTL